MTLLARPAEPALSGSDVLALIADSVICADEQGQILLLNRAAEKAFGYDENELIGQPVEMLLPPSYRARHAEQVRDFALGSGASSRLMGHQREVVGQRKTGEEFPAEATVSRQSIDGRTVLTAVLRDITERKALEEQHDAIAREMEHRIRNLISVVYALVSLTARSAATVAEFKEALLARLGAVARTQSVLGFGADQGTSLSELLRTELVQYQAADAANIVIEGPTVSLVPRAAQMLALAFHELATNSAKYGALSQASGRVAVTAAYTGVADSQIAIEWREAGGPLVTPPTRQGFGTTLIRQVIEKTFGARVILEFPPEGLVCRMTLPRATLEAVVQD